MDFFLKKHIAAEWPPPAAQQPCCGGQRNKKSSLSDLTLRCILASKMVQSSYQRNHFVLVCLVSVAVIVTVVKQYLPANLTRFEDHIANNTKVSKDRQVYVHQRDDVCYNHHKAYRHIHEVSDDFLSFGKESLGGWSWLGNVMLLRQLLHEIALNHPETRQTIHTQINFCMEYEHSLVLPGGINILQNPPIGKVPSIYQDGSYYTVFEDVCKLSRHDIIVQYSMPNIENFRLSNKFSATLLGKMIYVPPLEYEYNPYHLERDIMPITTFVYPEMSRRYYIIQDLEKKGIHVKNHNQITSRAQMKDVYDASAIMLNIHQTPYHHTLEELRIFPALMRGVIVISEMAPLIDAVPYSPFIVWSSIDDLPAIVRDVMQNYETYFDLFFGPRSKLPCILTAMRAKAYSDLEERILELQPKHI
jgi:hypothetical protein